MYDITFTKCDSTEKYLTLNSKLSTLMRQMFSAGHSTTRKNVTRYFLHEAISRRRVKSAVVPIINNK